MGYVFDFLFNMMYFFFVLNFKFVGIMGRGIKYFLIDVGLYLGLLLNFLIFCYCDG